MKSRVETVQGNETGGERRRLGRRIFWARTALALLVFACVSVASVQGVKLYRQLKAPPRAPAVPFGVNDYGRPVADALAASVEPDRAAGGGFDRQLELREGCAWGNPGRNPYKGTVEQALRRARLPEDVVAKLKTRIEAGDATDHVEITNDVIRTVREPGYFEPRAIKMTFGTTLCANTRVNFVPGHVEKGDFYEATDSAGRTYSVMVPYVCGNVSVLGARAERPDAPVPPAATPAVVAASGARAPTQLALAPKSAAAAPAAGGATVTPTGGAVTTLSAAGAAAVPEPASWSLLLPSAALAAWFGWRARARRRD